uniref:Uncharacterized protein n=1 Tax=Gredgaria maugeana TaxID=2007213 RepID=A0A1Z1MNH8_9FLOR|nr:hypothetical protein [Gredgaria maugeana]ARW67301.1 hypothetical protein [Gredgaria maugeana]
MIFSGLCAICYGRNKKQKNYFLLFAILCLNRSSLKCY